jgi:hypothetical protein
MLTGRFFRLKKIIFLFGHYDTSRKVAGSNSDEVIGFFSIYLILPGAL